MMVARQLETKLRGENMNGTGLDVEIRRCLL